MRRVSVTEARASWSRLLAAVEAGESVVITRYGKPVAHLAPPLRSGHDPLEPEGLVLDEDDLDLILDAADLYSE